MIILTMTVRSSSPFINTMPIRMESKQTLTFYINTDKIIEYIIHYSSFLNVKFFIHIRARILLTVILHSKTNSANV